MISKEIMPFFFFRRNWLLSNVNRYFICDLHFVTSWLHSHLPFCWLRIISNKFRQLAEILRCIHYDHLLACNVPLYWTHCIWEVFLPRYLHSQKDIFSLVQWTTYIRGQILGSHSVIADDSGTLGCNIALSE